MRVDDALTQVRALQIQVARMEQCTCYRWATVTVSGIVAIIAVAWQSLWVPNPAQHPDAFVALWVTVAALNVAIIGTEMLIHWVRSDSDYARRQTLIAVQQFAPCLIAGGLLTVAMRAASPESAAFYPGLWSIIFSLGIFSSWRFLPRHAILAAGHYLVAGVICVRWAQDEQALQPWTMLITFGAGQFITSLILYQSRETVDGAA